MATQADELRFPVHALLSEVAALLCLSCVVFALWDFLHLPPGGLVTVTPEALPLGALLFYPTIALGLVAVVCCIWSWRKEPLLNAAMATIAAAPAALFSLVWLLKVF
jgi:hypothetical protein